MNALSIEVLKGSNRFNDDPYTGVFQLSDILVHTICGWNLTFCPLASIAT